MKPIETKKGKMKIGPNNYLIRAERSALRIYILYCIAISITLITSIPVIASEISETEIVSRINELRGVSLPRNENETKVINEKLDSVWSFLRENNDRAIPILAEELRKELLKPAPDDFFLLDAGYLLLIETGKTYSDLVLRALERLDAKSEVIQANFRQLFEVTFAFASMQDSRVLPIVDRAFLSSFQKIFIPRHSLTLDPALMCVFLYGAYGPDSETHLLNKLDKDQADAQRILEILNWIGTDRSIEHVKKIMTTHRDYDTYVRSVGYFMRLGGPKGRSIVLNTDVRGFDKRTQDYFKKIKSDVKKQSFKNIAHSFKGLGGEKSLPDEVVKQRLRTMYENFGKDSNTNPMAILNSTLPEDYLINELIKNRSRMFHRLSDEALYDVEMTNSVINALMYKRAENER